MTDIKKAPRGPHTIFRAHPESLKRAAKRLQPLIQELIDEALAAERAKSLANEPRRKKGKAPLFNLAKSQESLAKALGWPSFSIAISDAQALPDETPILQTPNATGANPFFASCVNMEEAYGAISALLPAADDMWGARARLLLRGALRFIGIDRLRRMKAKDLARSLSFSELIANASNESEPEERREAIIGYLSSLPGYNAKADRHSETTREQHGYLEMQLLPIVDSLSSLEISDPLVIPARGFGQTKMLVRDSLGEEVISLLWALAPAEKATQGARLSTCLRALARCLNAETRLRLAKPLCLCLESPLLLESLCSESA